MVGGGGRREVVVVMVMVGGIGVGGMTLGGVGALGGWNCLLFEKTPVLRILS